MRGSQSTTPLCLVVCYDAGAAAILSALMARYQALYEWRFFSVRKAPAWAVATRHGLDDVLRDLDTVEDLGAELDALRPHLLVYGTGWQRQLQPPLLAYAKARGIPSLAVLDHWAGYRERFGYPQAGWQNNLPDHIAVVDAQARAIAEGLALPNLVSLRNYYYEDLLAEAEECRHRLPQEDRLLLLSEPTARVAMAHFGRADHWGFTEREYFISILEHFPRFGVRSLAVRLHPSDSPDQYTAVAQAHPHVPCILETPAESSLTASLIRSRLVIGLDSFALYIAYMIGLPAISYLPGGKRRCHIPLPMGNRVWNLAELDPRTLEKTRQPAAETEFGMEFPELVNFIFRHG